MNDVQPDVFAPARPGPVTPRNRIVKAATCEGPAKHCRVTRRVLSTEPARGAASA
jgi:2,4-dienoyl-CoA reductase-like NADH-dependent reductase (Old Yellow Enzyme family)